MSHAWSKQFSGDSTFLLSEVATDEYGNIFVVGEFRGSIVVSPTASHTSMRRDAGATDGVVASFSADGGFRWSSVLAGPGDESLNRVVSLPSGDVLIGGRFSNGAVIGGASVSPLGASFGTVMSISGANGAERSNTVMSSFNAVSLFQMRGTPDDGLVFTAAFEESAYSANTTIQGSGPGIPEGYLHKLQSDGGHQWEVTARSGHQVALGPVVVRSSGNVIVSGAFEQSALIGDTPLSAPSLGGFTAEADGTTGSILWVRPLDVIPLQLALTPSDTILIAGEFSGDVMVGPVPLEGAGGQDVFVAEIGAGGVPLWARSLGAAGDEAFRGLALDSRGNAIIAGEFYAPTQLGSFMLMPNGPNSNIFLLTLTTDHDVAWARRFGGDGTIYLTGLAVDTLDCIVLTGYFDGTVEFGGEPLTLSGNAILAPFLTRLTR